MYFTNRKKSYLVILLLVFSNILNAQIQIGASYGASFDFGKEINSEYKTNKTIEFKIRYKNKTLFQPYISITFNKVLLNYSDQIIKNQGGSKTIVINNTTSLKLGIESILKKINKYNFLGKFGVGTSFFNNPLVWIENSNRSNGYYTDYNPNKTENNFAFLDISIISEREISENWLIYLDFGSQYYPKENSVSIISQINNQKIEINSNFTKIRPYCKLGFMYSL